MCYYCLVHQSAFRLHRVAGKPFRGSELYLCKNHYDLALSGRRVILQWRRNTCFDKLTRLI